MTGVGIDRARVGAAVGRHARRTPLLLVDDLSERLGCEVWAKAECLQHTGSFKVRGAAARLDALDRDERSRGVVTCSSGNHGRAIAFVAGRMGIPARVYVPEWVDPVKLEGIRDGAEAVLAGATFDESEALAVEYARREGRTFVSAYDDPWVIAGQGTILDEIRDELPVPPSHVLVPLSGGGLAGGIASAVHAAFGGSAPAPATVAVSAENAAVMLASVRAGHPVRLPEEETLANALAGGIGHPNRFSFPLVRDLVDQHVTVSEDDIAVAMRYAATRLRLVVEGGGAVALAAILGGAWPADPRPDGDAPAVDGDAPAVATSGLSSRHAGPEGPVVVVLSGGNVALAALARLLSGGPIPQTAPPQV